MASNLRGRPKGALNKRSAEAKENIQAVFTRLGSTAAMAEWAKENKTEFYKLYSKLVAVKVEGNGPNGSIEHSLNGLELHIVDHRQTPG